MIIDALTYIGGKIVGHDGIPLKRRNGFFGVEDLITMMDRYNIKKAIAIPLFGDASKDYMPSNEYVAKAQEKYPQRIIGFCRLNPLYERKALEDLEICISELKLKGVYLAPRFDGYMPYGWGYETMLEPFYKKIEDLGIPMIIHCSGPCVLETPGQIAAVAMKHPSIPIIITHAGGPRMSIDTAVVALRNKNVFLETSETHSSFFIAGILKTIGADKIVFGSATPFIGPEIEKAKLDIGLKLGLISKEEYELIMAKNISRILRI
ncbi:hypothetical protein DRO64_02555 [Candidatus Bathyarchaeota archaeon]|nr:MAG: hypothetical protein DRO64_02555 [Candidatus Bathyarchaeota archaeon]